MRGGRAIALKAAVDEALALGGCDFLKTVVVYKRTGSNIPMVSGRDLWWGEAVKGQADTCDPVWVNAEHPLFILYTSGSTGKPKGVQHSTGGYLLWATAVELWMEGDARIHERARWTRQVELDEQGQGITGAWHGTRLQP